MSDRSAPWHRDSPLQKIGQASGRALPDGEMNSDTAMKKTTGRKSGTSRKAAPQSVPSDDAVNQYLESLDHPFKAEIEALRGIILKSDGRISEGIKWNAPSYYCTEWFATFNFRKKDAVQIIFHRGAKVKAVGDGRYVEDPSAVLKWITNDRCAASFIDINDVEAKAPALKKIVTQWVKNLTDEAKL